MAINGKPMNIIKEFSFSETAELGLQVIGLELVAANWELHGVICSP
jgi:hypothetical protein